MTKYTTLYNGTSHRTNKNYKEPVNYPGHCSEWASGNAITFK